MKVDTNDFSIISLELVEDRFQGCSSSASYIQKVSLQHRHVLHHLNVGGDCKEHTDEEVINEDWDFFY